MVTVVTAMTGWGRDGGWCISAFGHPPTPRGPLSGGVLAGISHSKPSYFLAKILFLYIEQVASHIANDKDHLT